jgi:4-hydroxybenzoate polyprenyltransferase
LAATKPAILMLMVGSLSCGILAVLLSFIMGISLIIAIPGLIIGAFFAFRYAMYDKTKATKEQQGKDRKTKRRRLNR